MSKDLILKNSLIVDLCGELKKDNNSFDSEKFIEACNE